MYWANKTWQRVRHVWFPFHVSHRTNVNRDDALKFLKLCYTPNNNMTKFTINFWKSVSVLRCRISCKLCWLVLRFYVVVNTGWKRSCVIPTHVPTKPPRGSSVCNRSNESEKKIDNFDIPSLFEIFKKIAQPENCTTTTNMNLKMVRLL